MPLSPHFIAATTDYTTYEHHVPAPAFRKSVVLPPLRSATLTVCGLGLYEFFLNGHRLTRGQLSPYISNPDHILYYDQYDLAEHLTVGENAFGFLLGNGLLNCWNGGIWDLDKLPCRASPKLALFFEAMTEDGKAITFDARDGFLCTESGILLDDLRAGEWFDARVLADEWTRPGFEPCGWREPLAAQTPRGEQRVADVDPILPTRELAPVDIHAGRIGRFSDIDKSLPVYPIPEAETRGFIYDFGINAAGLCRLHIQNTRPGQRITLIFGEKLTPEGDLDLWSMFYAPQAYSQRDVYICRGGEEESYTPSFTYHGFRYCLVTGVTEAQATPALLTYVVMNSSLKPRATFRCSDEVANRLWDATLVSDLANFYHFPTDCPQREKNGWTGDASLSAEQMLTALSCERNLREWLRNIRAAQREDGSLPGITPTGSWGYGHGPAWDNVIVNLPYYMWLYRGDRRVLVENADTIDRQLTYMLAHVDERGLVDYGLGDWCPAGQTVVRTPNVVTATLTCLDYCRKAAVIFAALGMTDRAARAEQAVHAFRTAGRTHLADTATCTVLGNTQTAQAMGLYSGLFTREETPAAFSRLLRLIEEADGTFDCGILGLRVLFHVLAEHGQADLAYRLITQKKFPSYGYLIDNGATSLWETFHRIEGNSPSLNHHFFGDILSWFLQTVVGIRVNPHQRDPNEIRLSPAFIASLSHAHGTYDAPAGRVECGWRREDGRVVLSYVIPAGVKAELCLPTRLSEADTVVLRGEGSLTCVSVSRTTAPPNGDKGAS